MKRFWLKGCSRRHGDLALGVDIYGTFVQCMQCGALSELPLEGVPAASADDSPLIHTTPRMPRAA